MDKALSSVGFFRLCNHGIEQRKIDACFLWNERLFTSRSTGDSESRSASSRGRGYSGVGKEQIRGQTCLKENFDIGNPNDDNCANVWPAERLFPGFRRFSEDFFKDCAKLTYQLLECLSLALGLSEGTSLGKYHADTLFNLSLIHYPSIPVEQRPSGTLTRNPPHSDFGTLTLLFQDEVGGLEIADPNSTSSSASATVERSGTFVHVDPEPGTIVVNVGYLLMKWTNGRWRNTVHKVSEPPRHTNRSSQSSKIDDGDSKNERDIPERYSTAYFSAPDPTTVVEAFQCCCNDEAPSKPINAGEYLRRKRAQMYTEN
ncbi:Clavaminate synthase-like protein [Polychaeton citri CBS 116435]|uniref:Clavaminate synthase-like protein n=1 Tax=Polychaeton citri CBS 116435 TaxID=1314669 RepID=A0A9P4UUN1_9PEZI|nr:Clavaminate synthase-like protein [Polychaeton citri CBS 116435]